MSTRRTSVLVVDDQPIFRAGIVSILSCYPDLSVVAEAGDGREAVRCAHAHGPDVVLMDLRMPVLDGVQATRKLRAERPASRVVVLTTFEDDASVVSAIQAGALGYLLKATPAEELAAAVRLAAVGQSGLSPQVATRVVSALARGGTGRPNRDAGLLSRLSPRETQVLTMVAGGSTNKDIARDLDLSEGTVKNHMTAVFSKLGVSDRLAAALFARDVGLTG